MNGHAAEYLCFCNQTHEQEFRASIVDLKLPDFNAVCMQTGVGINCTACVPDAERVYLGVLAGDVGGTPGLAPREVKSASLANRFHKFMRKISPVSANTLRSMLPVLGGAGHRTVLSVHHGKIKAVDAELVPVNISVALHDRSGRKLTERKAVAKPGERVEIDVTEPFAAGENLDLLGTALLALKASGLGHVGIIRPHFRVEGARAASPVHSVDAGDTDSHHVFATANGSTSYAVTVNGTEKEANIKLRTEGPKGDSPAELQFSVPPFGSAINVISFKAEGLRILHIESDQVQRSFFIVADRDMVSVDHI